MRRVPWKNGRGFTDELALWPVGASFERADFDWRISRAAVEEDGPFSSFPGIARVLVVIDGAGIVLDHGEHAPRARLEPLVPYRFSGDWPTTAQLVSGRIADFSVLCRRGAARADVEVWDGSVSRTLARAPTEHAFLHVLTGTLDARVPGHAKPWKLASGESLWLQPRSGEELALAGACRALLVRIAGIH